jgi:hypothetical protein
LPNKKTRARIAVSRVQLWEAKAGDDIDGKEIIESF